MIAMPDEGRNDDTSSESSAYRSPARFSIPASGRKRPSRNSLTDGPLDLSALFGRSAPLVVDLGCGNGRFLLGSAVWRPALDHLGIDILPVVIRYATRRANQRGLTQYPVRRQRRGSICWNTMFASTAPPKSTAIIRSRIMSRVRFICV